MQAMVRSIKLGYRTLELRVLSHQSRNLVFGSQRFRLQFSDMFHPAHFVLSHYIHILAHCLELGSVCGMCRLFNLNFSFVMFVFALCKCIA